MKSDPVRPDDYTSGPFETAWQIGYELFYPGEDYQRLPICQLVSQPAEQGLEAHRHTQWKSYLCWHLAQCMMDIGGGLHQINVSGKHQFAERKALVEALLQPNCTINTLLAITKQASTLGIAPFFRTESLRLLILEIPFLGLIP